MVNPLQEARSKSLLKEVLSLISWMGTLEKHWENHSTLKKNVGIAQACGKEMMDLHSFIM